MGGMDLWACAIIGRMSDSGDPPGVNRDLMEFALDLARRAGELITERFYAGPLERELKADGTEVTDVDVAIEEWYRAELSGRFSDDGFYGEETGETVGRSGRRWVIDPIGGTFWFVRGVPLFSTTLAYEDEYGPAVAVEHEPLLHQTVLAARGQGCWIERGPGPSAVRRRATFSRRRQLAGATAGVANLHCWSERFLTTLHREVLLLGGWSLSALVAGDLDAVVATHQDYEDLAIFPVIVGEAGGKVTAINGDPLLSGDGSILAANPDLHGQLCDLVAGLPVTLDAPRLAGAAEDSPQP
jgi:histidinol-phosphatase